MSWPAQMWCDYSVKISTSVGKESQSFPFVMVWSGCPMTTLMGCPTLATAPHTALRDTKGDQKKKKKENERSEPVLRDVG